MENSKYAEDLREIREMMSRSSRFISLSGLSGIIAGLLALGGAWLAYLIIYEPISTSDYSRIVLTRQTALELLAIAATVLVLSLLAGIYFTQRAARARNEKIWNVNSRRLLVNLAIPLITGGVVCLIFLFKGMLVVIAPLTLVFYGLALVNGSKYTLDEVRSLGIAEIILGIIALAFPGYGLLFWAVGFGILHILYGLIMKKRYGA
ncbi:hypothetical protein [Fulvivirga sedimenti]|uniref:DUF973 family protein n=1 Tax=Fulvivirga sedimenti TaxID=2879465 RepID=A0A9X1HM15_9BACT|nr:hypothetical protein [Fulvivirga sedimenti]MCA6073480.1 hypothetical protein [Fulvivirga sedimenti]